MRTARVLGTLALCLVSSLLLAQSVPSNPGRDAAGHPAESPADLTLEQLANVEIYSASKSLQLASDAPSATTVVTKDEIERYGYRNLADILRAVRGFYVTSDRNYNYVGVRGFGRLGDWNNRILVLIDGHRTNNNVFDQALLGQEFPVDVDLIERVEIVRGPGSSLYGSNAFFAVINVITRDLAHMKHWELSFEPGSFGTYKGRASYGGKLGGADALISSTVLSSDGQDLFFPEFNTPSNNHGVAVNADGLTYVHSLAELGWHDLKAQLLFEQRDRHVPTAPFGNIFNDPNYHVADGLAYLDMSYERRLAENWQIFVRTSWDRFRLSTPQQGAGPADQGERNRLVFRGDWWTGDVRLSRTVWRKHQITFGTEMRDNVQAQQIFASPIPNIGTESDSPSWIAAFYGQDQFSITANLTLNAGVRYDHYCGSAGTTNPRLALIYHPWAKTSLKMLYGTAFRAPDPSQVNPVVGGAFASNPDLAPETIRGIEGVVEQELGHRFSLSGSVFQNRIAGLISSVFDPGSGLVIYRNTARAIATGTEIEFVARSSAGWLATTSFTYVDADDGSAEDLPLTNSPRHVAKVNLSAPLRQKRLLASLDAQYFGRRHTLAGNTVGAYPLFNLTFLGHTWGKHMDLSASIYNLLDKKYSDPGRPEMVQDSLQQDGRNFRLKATVSF